MQDKDIERIALFFFLLTLDQNVAAQLSSQVVDILLRRSKGQLKELNERELVRLLISFFLKNKKTLQQVRSEIMPHFKDWSAPDKFNINIYREFSKRTDIEILVPFLLCAVLQFSDESVSQELNITKGTLASRLQKAYLKIGDLSRPERTSLSGVNS